MGLSIVFLGGREGESGRKKAKRAIAAVDRLRGTETAWGVKGVSELAPFADANAAQTADTWGMKPHFY